MLKIELHEVNNFGMSGSSVLRVLQNEKTPKADLLIRESVQNSLDAARQDKDFVDMDFIVNTFESAELSRKIELIGPILDRKFPNTNKYLAIRDKWTVGLDGPLHRSQVIGQDEGNLIKLIYGIAKPQEKSGAGGSWGYGKTIFYRIGIGLVFFYSRIKISEDNFEERLAAVMVEDETSKDAVIPPFKGTQKTGVAWWGQSIGENKTQPVTDSKIIHGILNVFGISAYQGDETGTTVIIPYINELEILRHNELKAANGNKTHQIYSNLADYLEISLQRWYAPRLNNKMYKFANRKYLTGNINGIPLSKETQVRFFQVIKDMYNYAINDNLKVLETISPDVVLTRDEILIRSNGDVVLSEQQIGYLVHGKFDYRELGMDHPNDIYTPHYLSNIEEEAISEVNSTIVTFCRQPGMLVNYENKGSWANALPSTSKEEFIVVLFVLNSDNEITFKQDDIRVSLEEYVRQGEEADHIEWHDHSKFGVNGRIITRIQSHVNNKVKNAFNEMEEMAPTDNDGKLSAAAGKLILPPVGFGQKARKNSKKSITTGITRNTGGIKSTIFDQSISYYREGIEIPFQILIKSSKVNELYFDIEVKLENKSISLSEYEDYTKKPSSLAIRSIKLENNNDEIYEHNNTFSNFSVLKSDRDKVYRLKLNKDFYVGEVLEGKIFIEAQLQEIVPVLRIKSYQKVEVKE